MASRETSEEGNRDGYVDDGGEPEEGDDGTVEIEGGDRLTAVIEELKG